jgi:O-antigen ligase
VLVGLLGLGAVLCLVWSGSKSGQFIVLVQALLLSWLILGTHVPVRLRRLVVVVAAVVGLAAVVSLNLDYFKRGARSVGARADYWTSAAQAFVENPITGTGPGTFGEFYQTRKADDSEMARLAHNDFVQQASDSGAPGFVCYGLLVVGALVWSYRRLRPRTLCLTSMVWLGLFGWAAQSLSEFGLYIPAIAWSAFFLLGSLCREAANQIDTPAPNP